jgi:hydrogenase maturation protease
MSDSTPPAPAHTLVLALGSPLRADDGVGQAVVKALQAVAVPAGVALLDGGTPGLETVLLLQGYQRTIIIDAADLGREPGDWVRFTPDQANLGANDTRAGLHAAGLAEALELGRALGILPDEIIIYGIQPQTLDWLTGLSEAVQAAIPALCTAILAELTPQECER